MRRISLILLSILLLLNGCGRMQPPPSQKIENIFQQYREELGIITDFLLLQEHDRAIFSSDDLKSLPENVGKAVKTLRKQAGCSSIHLSGETVCFVLWTRFTDAGCGVAYTMADSPEAALPFLTQLESLSEPGWFYYVEDYAQWRTERSS